MIANVRSKSAGLLASVLVAAALAGCTSSAPKPQPTGAPTSASRTATPIPTQHSLPAPSDIHNDLQLRRQVAITSCTSRPGGWQASGKAVNPGKRDVDLTITVFFTTSGATVLDYATTKVTVPGGGNAKWTAAARFAAEANMRCVLRGVA